MINNSEITTKFNHAQVAGLHSTDTNSEFVGVPETLEVIWLYQGRNYPWASIPKWVYRLCQKKYLSDPIATEQLGSLPISQDRQIELFIYHSYGSIDTKADIIDGELQPSENYRHSKNCPSLEWATKNMTIEGVILNDRELFIIDCYKEDVPDKMIAFQLGITESTLNTHKRNLATKIGAQSKMGVLVKSLKEGI